MLWCLSRWKWKSALAFAFRSPRVAPGFASYSIGLLDFQARPESPPVLLLLFHLHAFTASQRNALSVILFSCRRTAAANTEYSLLWSLLFEIHPPVSVACPYLVLENHLHPGELFLCFQDNQQEEFSTYLLQSCSLVSLVNVLGEDSSSAPHSFVFVLWLLCWIYEHLPWAIRMMKSLAEDWMAYFDSQTALGEKTCHESRDDAHHQRLEPDASCLKHSFDCLRVRSVMSDSNEKQLWQHSWIGVPSQYPFLWGCVSHMFLSAIFRTFPSQPFQSSESMILHQFSWPNFAHWQFDFFHGVSSLSQMEQMNPVSLAISLNCCFCLTQIHFWFWCLSTSNCLICFHSSLRWLARSCQSHRLNTDLDCKFADSHMIHFGHDPSSALLLSLFFSLLVWRF